MVNKYPPKSSLQRNDCYVVRIGLLAIYKILLLVKEVAEQSTGDWPNWITGSIAFFDKLSPESLSCFY